MPDYDLTIEEEGRKITACTTTASIEFDDAQIRNIALAAKVLNTAIPLKNFQLSETEGVYLYKFKAVDGRVWKQTLTFGEAGVAMTFDIQGAWRLAEFEPHRALRTFVIAAIESIGLRSLEITWEAE